MTGYTAFIEDGEITNGKDFLKLCTRAFGVAIELKDEPLEKPTPIKFEPDKYYFDEYINAVKRLEHTLRLTQEQMKEKMIDDFEKRKRSAETSLQKCLSQNATYDRIRNEVLAWIPPTTDHEGVKKFALEQINMSYYTQSYIENLENTINRTLDVSDDAVKAFLKEYVQSCEYDVERAKDKWRRELLNAEKRNEFMRVFLASLSDL